MTRWGMVIDLDLCTGCNACVIACRQENNIPFVNEEEFEMGRAIRWMELVPVMEAESPTEGAAITPRNCFHCENPPCIKVCPVEATYKNDEGLVGQIYYRCIGCRYCTVACPYTARYFNWFDYHKRLPDDLQKPMNPEVSPRMHGVVEKCTYCHHRIREAKSTAKREGRALRDGEVQTACAQSCPADAIYFGDLDDPKSTVSKRAKTPRSFVLLEDLGTKPKTMFLNEVKEEFDHD